MRGLKPRGLLQPTSPLRVINSPGQGAESPADLLADQDDREVEIMMTADNSSLAVSIFSLYVLAFVVEAFTIRSVYFLPEIPVKHRP